MQSITLLVLALAAPPDRVDEQPVKEAREMQGKWQAVTLEENGAKAGRWLVDEIRAEIKGKNLTLKSQGIELGKFTFTVDPSKEPKQIDCTRDDGNGGKQVLQGIYKFHDGTLTLCIAKKGKRPEAFKTENGSVHFVLILKREKK